MNCEIYDISCWFGVIQEEVKLFFLWLLDNILQALATIFDAIPAPEFAANTITIPSNVAYFADPFNIPLGVSMIVTAYIARFLLRRIPFIGG
jgi:hypothetical protein